MTPPAAISPAPAPAPATPVEVDPVGIITRQLTQAVEGFFQLLPNILAALLLLIIAWFLAGLVQRLVRRVLEGRGRPDLGGVLGAMARGAVIVGAWLFASAIVFPSIRPGDILSMLGIGSVAVGFAFKDILQNLLAGLLLLIRRPYKRGDQIVVKDYEGTVEHIESRATLIKTYDGRRVIIPNSDVYTSPVIVNTAFETRRDEFVIGIGYGDKPSAAIETFLAAIRQVKGVATDPAPDVLPHALNDSTVDLKARWWTRSTRADQVQVRARVILALYEAAAEHGIDLPFPTTVMLFHDQTEETDGDRTRQREGWPAGERPPPPRRPARASLAAPAADAADRA